MGQNFEETSHRKINRKVFAENYDAIDWSMFKKGNEMKLYDCPDHEYESSNKQCPECIKEKTSPDNTNKSYELDSIELLEDIKELLEMSFFDLDGDDFERLLELRRKYDVKQ